MSKQSTAEQSKLEKIKNYDPSSLGLHNGNLFGLPFDMEECDVVLIPVPWEVTVSYRLDTAKGPEQMLNASYQVDLYDEGCKDAWRIGVNMLPISKVIVAKNKLLREKAERIIAKLESGVSETNLQLKTLYHQVNHGSMDLNAWLSKESNKWISKGKIVGVVGGEHSASLGLMHALAKTHKEFGILHFDAHADLREAFEGFAFSHASIMYNAMTMPQVKKLVQVGIRDFCEEEQSRMIDSKKRIVTYTDRIIQRKLFEGSSWKKVCKEIVNHLPKEVYISFDIDALIPFLCPNTGTPVQGGLDFEQAMYLIEQVVESHRKIIGFDLCEVANGKKDEWDAIVGVRVLYRLANLTAQSRKKV